MKLTRTVHRALTVALLTCVAVPALAAADPTPDEAAAALRKAVAFFSTKVAVQGGYVWRYSADLSKREGEGKVGLTTVWVQPPGTPTVGQALVEAYELTGEQVYLDAARDAAMCMVKGQLHSGGWNAGIELAPVDRARQAYRVDGRPGKRARNHSSLDDDKTQSSLRFLMRYDKATAFKDPVVHEATMFALNSLLGAQFANGGWPQVYDGPADPEKYPPTKAAGYRTDGPDTHAKAYWYFSTLNDNLIPDVVAALLLAHRVYGDRRCLDAALKAGDFLILAQMPDPQPGWAQQYDLDMHPCWARKFEPAAITGGESQGAMTTLLDLYELTGQRKYLAPIPMALAYYKRSLLPDGRLARFYELKTNKPLYFTRDYKLTYSDADAPTHYSFKVGSKLDRIERRYKALSTRPWQAPQTTRRATTSRPSAQAVRRVIDAMDPRGAWVEDGQLRYWGKADPTTRVIDPRTFVKNVNLLARYVTVSK